MATMYSKQEEQMLQQVAPELFSFTRMNIIQHK